MLSRDEILKIAKLARLKLSSDEVEKFARQLNDILDFFEILQKCDTAKFKPAAQSVKLPANTRDDSVVKFESEKLLKNSPNEIYEKQIVVKNVFE
jgi:aspartyl-tRNA(Asn)/glutamyl-tRNA(Gln) amidotransferase subunit C